MRGVVVEISAHRFGIPFECPCCGAPPAGEVRVGPRAALFPSCKRCLAHVKAWDNAGVGSALAMVLTIAAAAIAAIVSGVLLGLAVFVAGATIAWFVRKARRAAATAMRGPSCAASGVAVDAPSTQSFTFESPTFAARFAEENKALLVHPSPQLQRLVAGYHRARLAVPTPAIAAGIAPPPLNQRDWLVRIEATEGTLARRVQLQRALDMTNDALLRRELVQLVARLELAPLIAKLRRIVSVTGKKQLIEDSIAKVRLDNLSDELESAELHELQSRLSEP